MIQALCAQCGTRGPARETAEESWQLVFHDGHGHKAELLPWQEANQQGLAVTADPELTD